MITDGELDLVHNLVLELFRRGQSPANISFLLTEELNRLGTAIDYFNAIKESHHAP